MFTVGDARKYAKAHFERSPQLQMQEAYDASLDADVLVSFCVKKNRAWVIAHQEEVLGDTEALFLSLVEKRGTGYPIAYCTGEKEFFGIPFFVSEDVLIPKPDTELLVEQALEAILSELSCRGEEKPFLILDMCTGSGCIGLSLLHELSTVHNKKNIRVLLADISNKALALAKKNAKHLFPSLERGDEISFIQADLRDSFPVPLKAEKYDLIVSNPPYVPTAVAQSLLKDGRSEPLLALDGGANGLDLILPLADNAIKNLKEGGRIFIEVGEYHAVQAKKIVESVGFSQVRIHKDLSLHDRLIEGCLYGTQ